MAKMNRVHMDTDIWQQAEISEKEEKVGFSCSNFQSTVYFLSRFVGISQNFTCFMKLLPETKRLIEKLLKSFTYCIHIKKQEFQD